MVAVAQQVADLLLGARNVVGAGGADHEHARDKLLQPALNLGLKRGVGHEDDIVLVLAHDRLPLAGRHPHYLKGEVLDAHGLPDGIRAGAIQLLDHGLAEHDHRAAGHILAGVVANALF